jgi:hypothetical protein
LGRARAARLDVRLGTLIRTASCALLDGKKQPELQPLGPRELQRAAKAATPSELERVRNFWLEHDLPSEWVEVWLSDFAQQIVKPGGTL